MSTDPTQRQAPVPPAEEEAPDAAPPTVQAPAQSPGQGSARGWQEPATAAVPAWPATPPPPPPPPPGKPAAPRPDAAPAPEPPPRQDPAPRQDSAQRRQSQDPTVLSAAVQPTERDRPAQPTMYDQTPRAQWGTPAQQQRPGPQHAPTQQAPAQAAPGQAAPQPTQRWQQPQRQQEPRDTPPPQWSPPQPQFQAAAAAQGTPPAQGQQGQWPPAQPPVQPPAQGRKAGRRGRRRPVRRSVMALFAVIVVLILLVIADRVALAVAENEFASQAHSQGLPVKPSVTIEGFPFLTQLIGKDFNKVDISASNIPVQLPDGAGSITIDSVHATMKGLHISGYSANSSATADQVNATAFISFGALAAAGGLGQGTGITITQDGPDKLKISAGLGGVFTDTEEAQISQTGPQTISVKVLPSNGALGSLLSSFGSFSFSLPKGVPASLRITGLTLNSQGLNVSAAATNAKLGQ